MGAGAVARRCVAAALLWAAGMGCADELPPAARIDKMRVLAVRAEPPEIAAGQTTTLEALVAQPLTAAPALTRLWMACREPVGTQLPSPCGITALGNGGPGTFADDGAGNVTLAMPSCADAPAAPLCLLGEEEAARFTPSVAGADAVSQLLVTLVVSDEGPGSARRCALAAASSGTGAPPDVDHCTIAIKRVSVAAAGSTDERNANPRLAALTLGGADLVTDMAGFARTADGQAPASPALEAARCTSVAPGAACPDGAWAQRKGDGSYEVVYVSWFATAGTPREPRSSFGEAGCSGECLEGGGDRAHTEWTAPTADELELRAPGGTVRFWAVIRDDRNGVGWLTGTAASR